jgi:hypothetical protein
VLLRSTLPRSGPLTLSAAKSCMGHAEPAAGVVGVTRLALLLGQQEVDPLLTLRTLNPYVASAVAGAAQHGDTYRTLAPRQLMAAASPTDAPLIGGISSFAFQGTNAHAVISKQLLDAASFSMPSASAGFLRAAAANKARFWVLPPAHPFAASASIARSAAGPATVHCEGNLGGGRLTLLAHHTVLGRVLFPATGMLEAALAAGITLLDAQQLQQRASALALTGMSISSPIIIPAPTSGSKGGNASIVMRCSVSPASGTFTLSHAQQQARASTQNATGSYALAASMVMAVGAVTHVALRLAAVRHWLVKNSALQLAAAGAFGGIVVQQRMVSDGYVVPPTCMDACLHLGVVAPGSGAKVPVSVGAFSSGVVREGSSGLSELHGSTTAAGLVAGSIDVASFGLLGGRGQHASGVLANLSALETKVIKQRGADTAKDAAKVSVLLYVLEEVCVCVCGGGGGGGGGV